MPFSRPRTSRCMFYFFFFFSSRRRHTRSDRDWSSDVCSSDLGSSKSSVCGLCTSARAISVRLGSPRSGEGRGGEEGRFRWAPGHLKKKKKNERCCQCHKSKMRGGRLSMKERQSNTVHLAAAQW